MTQDITHAITLLLVVYFCRELWDLFIFVVNCVFVRFHHIDYLFLNAGIMPGTTVDWSNFWKQLFSS